MMTLSWITLAVLSAAVMGVISIFDAHMIQRRMPSWQSFLLGISIYTFIYTIVLFFIIPVPTGVGAAGWAAAVVAGILRGIAFAVMLSMMQREEVTRVVPVVGVYPVFVALLAIPLLGEQLSGWQWLAVAIAVGGTVLVSIKRDGGSGAPFLTRTFWILLAAALVLAISDVGNKYALEVLPTWNVYTISTFFMALIFSSITLRRRFLKELWVMPRRGLNHFLVFLNVAIAMLGIWLTFEAMNVGPVSLVATILGSRHVFVFVYGLIVSRVFRELIDWDGDRRSLVLRFLATLMISGSIALIYIA
jgi:drug/metabolite transporter (DMT)-like permease